MDNGIYDGKGPEKGDKMKPRRHYRHTGRGAGMIFAASCIACALLLATALPAAAAGEDNTGWYVVHWFNGDGTEVYFDSEHKGTITNTELTVAIDPSDPPAREYTVRRGDRILYTGFFDRIPVAGETIDLFPRRFEVEEPAPGVEVNDTGWYLIYRPDGERVYFDDKFVGVVEGGALRVAVNTSLPPSKEFTCRKDDGWTMSRHEVPLVPPRGGTVHVYTAVQSAPHASSLPAETASPPLMGPGAAGVVAGLLIAAAVRLGQR